MTGWTKVCGHCGSEFRIEYASALGHRHCSRSCAAKSREGDPADRFWAKVVVASPAECWLWTGELNNKGYGRHSLTYVPRKVRVLAHRYAYQLVTGEDITGRVLLHSCDNPPCVNPAHLRPGTQLENIRDAKEKGRMNLDGLAVGWELKREQRRERLAEGAS